MENLNLNDLQVIKESLKYSKYNIENSKIQPSYEDKQKKLIEIAGVMSKVSAIIN